MTLKNNRTPLLSISKLYASFHHHMWIQTGVTVRKRLSWIVTSVTLTFDLWPWPFAWTLPWSVVTTSENFMMIRWWKHSKKGVIGGQTDRQTDRRTENTIHRAARSQLKRNETNEKFVFCYVKLTNELSYKIRFPISGPTCRRQVLIYGTKHRDDNQLWGLQFHCRISLFRIQIWCKGPMVTCSIKYTKGTSMERNLPWGEKLRN